MYFNIELENLLLLFSALGANYFIRQSIHVCLMYENCMQCKSNTYIGLINFIFFLN